MHKRNSSSNSHSNAGYICGVNQLRPKSYLEYSFIPSYQQDQCQQMNPTQCNNQTQYQQHQYQQRNLSSKPKTRTPKTVKKINREQQQFYTAPSQYNPNIQVMNINDKRNDIINYKRDEGAYLEKNNLSQLLTSLKQEIVEISKNIKDTDGKIEYYIGKNQNATTTAGRSRDTSVNKLSHTTIPKPPHTPKYEYITTTPITNSYTNHQQYQSKPQQLFDESNDEYGINNYYSKTTTNMNKAISTGSVSNINGGNDSVIQQRLLLKNESLEKQVMTLQKKLNSSNSVIPELLEKNNSLTQENIQLLKERNDLQRRLEELELEFQRTKKYLLNEIDEKDNFVMVYLLQSLILNLLST